MTLLALSLVAVAGATDCEDPGPLVGQAEDAVIEARFEDTQALLKRAETALSCREVTDKALIARMFLVQGAWMSLSGSPDDASAAFASAFKLAGSLSPVSTSPAWRRTSEAL